MAHAFVASATHFHRGADASALYDSAALVGEQRDGQSAPLSGDDAQCLLCRLQRDFVSELRGAALALAPPPAEPVGYASLTNVHARPTRTLLPPGRAPPTVCLSFRFTHTKDRRAPVRASRRARCSRHEGAGPARFGRCVIEGGAPERESDSVCE